MGKVINTIFFSTLFLVLVATIIVIASEIQAAPLRAAPAHTTIHHQTDRPKITDDPVFPTANASIKSTNTALPATTTTSTFTSAATTSASVQTDPARTGGKLIVVSLSNQWLHAYENNKEILSTPVTTGRPALATPTGTYHVISKLSPAWFYSPWPKGSPYYYEPSESNYALGWRAGGYYLHDSPWRGNYGPGTNTEHTDSLMGRTTGTHGCVNLPIAAEAQLYNWASIGTTVEIDA